MRSIVVASLLVPSLAIAAPAAVLDEDLDGDGVVDHAELDASGTLTIRGAGGTASVASGEAGGGKLAGGVARGVPTIVVSSADHATIVQRERGAWQVAGRTTIGGIGLDNEYGTAVTVRPEGVLRYQTRGDVRRCDGKPALLYAEIFDGAKFRRLAELPTDVPDGAPALTARVDAAPAAVPLLFQARAASLEASAPDAGALGIPRELDDGDVATAWREDLVAGDGTGQFFTFEPRMTGARAAQLRIVPGDNASAAARKASNRPQRIAIVAGSHAWQVELPDGAGAPLGTAYVVDLPEPIESCVTVVLESTYGPKRGATAIAELELFGENERATGGEAALAHVIATGGAGAVSAAQALGRRGAAGAAALTAELDRATDDLVRVRIVRAAMQLRDPAAAPILARAALAGWVHDKDLLELVAALAALGQTAELKELAMRDGIALDARITAIAALGAGANRGELVELAGSGPRAVRHAVIDALVTLPADALVSAAQAHSAAPASGDLWRAAARRARAQPGEAPAVAAAMTAALAAASDYERRYRLVDGVAALGDAAALGELGRMLRALPAGAERFALEQVAAAAIAIAPRPAAVDLADELAREPEAGVRLAALAALGASTEGTAGAWHGSGGPDAIDRAIGHALAADTWPEVRRRAAQLLGARCERPGPARMLFDSIARDPDLFVRGDALAAAVECKAAGVAAVLARVWDDGKLPLELRKRAVELAAVLGDPAVGAQLVGKLGSWRGAALDSADALALAQSAEYAIGRLAPRGGAEALIDALNDIAYPEIIAAAATALGAMGTGCPAAAKAKLRELARSEDTQVRPAAAHAAALCGREPGR